MGVAVAVDGVGGETLERDVPLLAVQVVEQPRPDGGDLAAAHVQADVRGHGHGEEDEGGQVGDVGVLDGDVDGPARDAVEGADGDVLDLVPGHAHVQQPGREGGGELVADEVLLHLDHDGLQRVETLENALDVNVGHAGIAVHLQALERHEIAECVPVYLGAFIKMGHAETLETVEILEVPADDVCERVVRHVQTLQQLGLGQDIVIDDPDVVVGRIEVDQEWGLQEWHLRNARPRHVESANSLRFIKNIDDGVGGERVEGEVHLLDVDEDVGVAGDNLDVVVGDLESLEAEVLVLQHIGRDLRELVVGQVQALQPEHLRLLEQPLGDGGQVVVAHVKVESQDALEQVALQLRDVVVTDVNELKLGRVLESSFTDGLNLIHGQF